MSFVGHHDYTLHERVRHTIEIERSRFCERVSERLARIDQSRIEALVDSSDCVLKRISVGPFHCGSDSYCDFGLEIVDVLDGRFANRCSARCRFLCDGF